ncbi:UNVERIFIED_ORG: hypothetical protein GCAPEGMB_00533 [Vibrio phage V07]
MATLFDNLKGYVNTASDFLDENLSSDIVTRALTPTGVGLLKDVYKDVESGVTKTAKEVGSKAYDIAEKGTKQFAKASVPITSVLNSEDGVGKTLEDAGILTLDTDVGKEFFKNVGEKGAEAYKKSKSFVSGIIGDDAPSSVAEPAAVIDAMETPKLDEDQYKEVREKLQEEVDDRREHALRLHFADRNTKEGKNAWERTAKALNVPLDWLLKKWDEFDETAGGYPSGAAGLLGDAGGAVAEGAAFLNDKIDFITMLSIGAQAASNRDPVSVAVLKGLGAGVQARQQQKAAAAKQKREDAKWAAEQNVREYNALVNGRRQQASLLDKENKPLELSTSDRSIAKSYAADNKVAQSVVEDAIIRLKSVNQPVTPTTIQNAIKQGVASGAYDEPMFFGKTTLMD